MLSLINPGEIDVACITTLGVNVKEGETPIGFFGTGVKYGIATFLRLGCEITIWSGLTKYEFSLSSRDIRGKSFQIVHMNGSPLGFTSDLGKKWMAWMALREFWSNMKDEGGQIFTNEIQPKAGQTTVWIKGTESDKAWETRHDWLLQSKEPIDKSYFRCHIHAGSSKVMFFQGIAVGKLEKPAVFTYDLIEADLTEDRTLRHPHEANALVKLALANCKNPSILRRVLLANERDSFEGGLSFEGYTLGDVFLDTVEELFKTNAGRVNFSAVKQWKRQREIVDPVPTINLSSTQQAQLNKAKTFLKALGFDTSIYKITVVSSLGDDVYGMAHRDTGEIVLSSKCFTKGTKFLASTLLEEFIHLDTGYGDCTYNLQTYLFDLIITQGEERLGEPL